MITKEKVVNNIQRLNVFVDEVKKQNYAYIDRMTLAELKLFLNTAGFSFELNETGSILGRVKLDEDVYNDMRAFNMTKEEYEIHLGKAYDNSMYRVSHNYVSISELDMKIAFYTKSNNVMLHAKDILELFNSLLKYYEFQLIMDTDYFETSNLTFLEKIVNKYKLNTSNDKEFHLLKKELKGHDVKFKYILMLDLVELNYNGRSVNFKINKALDSDVQSFVKKIKFEKHAEESTSILV